MRITKRTNLAMRVLMFCAVRPQGTVTKAQVARGCNSSENHLGHVINRLGQLGYLETMRGRGGGIRLARTAAEISVGSVFRQLEDGVPVIECLEPVYNTCPLQPACRLRGQVSGAMEAFFAHLDGVTLDSLVASNTELDRILAV